MWSSRQLFAVAGILLLAGALALLAARSRCRTIEAGFWFEDVTFDASRLGGPITRHELDAIGAIARHEITSAFAGLNITFTERRDASHRVGVVQELRDMRFSRPWSIPAESRPLPGLGGQGAVSFSWLASSAITYAPEDASRTVILEAIGRGIGRSAVHEFAHLILPKAPIHDSKDIASYEYHSAARREQYFGDMHWERARLLLEARLARCGNEKSGL